MLDMKHLLLIVALLLALPQLTEAGKPKPKPPFDPRILVTAIDLAKKSITLTTINSKVEDTVTLADEGSYGKNEIIINGESKKFSDIKVGLMYVSMIEVQHDVASSLTFVSDPGAPKVPGSTTVATSK